MESSGRKFRQRYLDAPLVDYVAIVSGTRSCSTHQDNICKVGTTNSTADTKVQHESFHIRERHPWDPSLPRMRSYGTPMFVKQEICNRRRIFDPFKDLTESVAKDG
jgi:hypothetical protein